MGKSSSKSKSKKKKRTIRLIKQLLILFVLFVFLGSGYYYITYHEQRGNQMMQNNQTGEYTEVIVDDSTRYETVVIYKNDVNINTIATTFYKSNIFWPYIYIENKDVIQNPLNIEKDVLIKIPKLPNSLIDLNNTASIEKAKHLADSILENTKEPA